MAYKQLAFAFLVSILVVATLSAVVPQASAASNVTIRFAADGFVGYSGQIITIDETVYTVSDLSWKSFSWAPGTTHTISAVSSFKNTNYPSINYTFQSWSNGDGLVDLSGTYITPSADSTVTMHYVSVTHLASFSLTGITAYYGGIMIIDGTAYTVSDLGWQTFPWDYGTVHTVQAITPVTNTEYPAKTFAFQSWTNGGSDLTGVSGTVTMPNNDISITANYGSNTQTATFDVSGLTAYYGDIIKIDGTTYTTGSLPSQTFAWEAGTTHTIQAVTPVKNTDSPAKYYNFSSWTNGNGLTAASGTFTMPSGSVTVTANYAKSSSHVSFATSGVTDMNSGITVLTVDGQTYDYYNVANINAVLPEWNITSTHTVTAAPTLTDWNGITHYFQGWTNGNGLTTNSGTLTTPATDVTVTANYDTEPPETQTPTALTINCGEMTEERVTTITGLLTSGSGGISGKTISLSYYDGAAWVSIVTVTTASDGTYTYDWTIPTEIANGQYPVQAEFAGDISYQTSTAFTGSPGNSGNLTVLPESSVGSIVALVACFAGTLAFFKIRAKYGVKKTA